MRFGSLKLTTCSASKPPSASSASVGTTPAIFAGTSWTRLSDNRRMPDRPARSRCQTKLVPQPSGETMPQPVTTMRRILLLRLDGRAPLARKIRPVADVHDLGAFYRPLSKRQSRLRRLDKRGPGRIDEHRAFRDRTLWFLR